jgi:hypothetical protein
MVEWQRLHIEITAVTMRVGNLLRAGGAPPVRVSWSAAEVGAHLVSLPSRYRRMFDAPRTFPASIADENQREIDKIGQRDPAALADLLTAEVAAFLDDCGPDGDRAVHYFTVQHTVRGVAGILLAELLMHGSDLARDRNWPIEREQAVACLDGALPATVLSVDAAAARRATGIYHLGLRGDGDWTYRIRDGAVTVGRGRPDRADVHISADPVVFLRNAYGRLGAVRASLSGGILMWGRRPWLARPFGAVFVRV